MTAYIVQWNYMSGLGGPWEAGARVELDEVRAADINRDSPGVLVAEAPVEEQPTPEARDRMVKRAKHRGQGGPQEPIDATTFKAVKNG